MYIEPTKKCQRVGQEESERDEPEDIRLFVQCGHGEAQLRKVFWAKVMAWNTFAQVRAAGGRRGRRTKGHEAQYGAGEPWRGRWQKDGVKGMLLVRKIGVAWVKKRSRAGMLAWTLSLMNWA
jgi:hypothetical protein